MNVPLLWLSSRLSNELPVHPSFYLYDILIRSQLKGREFQRFQYFLLLCKMVMPKEVKVVRKQEEEEEMADDEPVSPTGQYFNSSALSVAVLAIFESDVPIDDSPTMSTLQNLFLPISPRFSSIMVSKLTSSNACYVSRNILKCSIQFLYRSTLFT